MMTTPTMPHTSARGAVPGRILDLEMLQSSRFAGDPLSLIKLRALLCLSYIGPQSVEKLADQLHVEKTAIDRLCQPLVTRGFVIRIPRTSPDDSSSIVLSTAGRRFVNHLLYRNTDAFERRRPSRLVHPDDQREE